jgi:pimeloyl-ACP methyl ester carboxylesterase
VGGAAGRRCRQVFAVVTALLTVALAGCGGPGPQTVELSACEVQGVAARCGSFAAFEDRPAAKGRRITLRVVVLPAMVEPTQPDPIVYFASGPGDAATNHVGDMDTILGSRDRDVVFVDQRGTGGSHRLACPPSDASAAADAGRLGSSVRSCLA